MSKGIFLFLMLIGMLIGNLYYQAHQQSEVPISHVEGSNHAGEQIHRERTMRVSFPVNSSSEVALSEQNLPTTVDLKKLVMSFPSVNTFDYKSKQAEHLEVLAKNKIQTGRMLQLFGHLDQIKLLFGDEQAKARVKLLEFFKFIKKDYSSEIVKSLIEIQQDPAFTNKDQGREYDYRDLAQIYFSSLSEEYLKYNLVSELKKIEYNPRDNWLIAYAIAHSHPNLLKDREFTETARQILAEETI